MPISAASRPSRSAGPAVALLIGHIRSRQIANSAELEAELAEYQQHCAAVADLCADLRTRTEYARAAHRRQCAFLHVDIAEAVSGFRVRAGRISCRA